MTDKKTYKKKLKQMIICQAAEEIFLEKPYNSISVDEIARHAGVTKKTLYNYFPSKLALFINMFEDYLQLLNLQLTEVFLHATKSEEAFLNSIKVLFQFTKKNEKFMRLFWTIDTDEFNGTIPPELVHRVKLWNKTMLDEMVGIIKKGKNEGVIADCNPELLVHLISAMNKGIFIHVNKENKFSIANIEPETLFNAFTKIICDHFFNKSSEDLINNPINKNGNLEKYEEKL